jgi:hypothetical protein
VGERDVANAALVKMHQVGEVAVDRGAVLHAHRQRYDTRVEVFPDVRRRGGDRELAVRGLDDIFHQVNEFLGLRARTALGLQPGGRVNRHERGVETSLPGARVVEIAALGRLADIFVRVDEPVWDVDMGVDDDGFVRDPSCLGGKIHGGRGVSAAGSQQDEGERQRA